MKTSKKPRFLEELGALKLGVKTHAAVRRRRLLGEDVVQQLAEVAVRLAAHGGQRPGAAEHVADVVDVDAGRVRRVVHHGVVVVAAVLVDGRPGHAEHAVMHRR